MDALVPSPADGYCLSTNHRFPCGYSDTPIEYPTQNIPLSEQTYTDSPKQDQDSISYAEQYHKSSDSSDTPGPADCQCHNHEEYKR